MKTLSELQDEMENAATEAEKAVAAEFESLDCDDMLDAALSILGPKHPATKKLQQAIKRYDDF